MTPLRNKIGAIFIPVRDIVKAREWYCGLLDIPVDTVNIVHGHLCVLRIENLDLILDMMPMWGGREPDGPPTFQTPVFMLLTRDLEASYQFMKEKGAELVTEIQDHRWFAFRDPDGNLLMICRDS